MEKSGGPKVWWWWPTNCMCECKYAFCLSQKVWFEVLQHCWWRLWSSGMLCGVILQFVTHILQELAASIIRVYRKCKLYHYPLKLALFGLPSFSSKTSISKYRPTWHCVPEYCNLRSY
jgi:hypothetical protein